MRRNAFHVAALVAVLAGSMAGAARGAETERFTATAHDLKTDGVLYTEQYEVQVDNGRWLSGSTKYLTPAGQQFAERKFDFAQDRYVPVFTLEQTDYPYREGITRIDANHVDLFNVRDGKRSAETIARVKEMVGDCGAQAYVIDHLDALQSGTTLHFTLAVAGRTDSFALRATKSGDADVGGRKAMRVRIELDSVLRLVLPKLELVVDPDKRRVLEYSGVANVKDPATQKAYSARIVFAYR